MVMVVMMTTSGHAMCAAFGGDAATRDGQQENKRTKQSAQTLPQRLGWW
jgi:hypothetical protein